RARQHPQRSAAVYAGWPGGGGPPHPGVNHPERSASRRFVMAYDVAFQTKVFPILREAITSALSSVAEGRVYWQQTTDETYPQVVFQAQAPGKRADYLSANGWVGPISFRALALDPDEADTLLASIPALVRNLSSSGYSLDLIFDKPAVSYWEDSTAGRIFTA